MDDYTIKDRLYKALNISIPNLYFFLKIASIKIDESIPTACISCSSEPILRINPKFVNKYCKSNEHLLMLVLHELYHFILGHTTFKIQPDDASNIVFDAVINSTLCKIYKEDKYTSFFTKLYKEDNNIECLLRPMGKSCPKEAINIVTKLYTSNNCSYKEIFDYLLNNENITKNVILLGSHGKRSDEEPENKQLVDAIISEMQVDNIMKEAGKSNLLEKKKITLEDLNKEEYRRLTKYFVDSTLENAATMMLKCREQNCIKDSFMPNSKDRMAYARSLFYTNVIHRSPSNNKRMGLIEGGKSRVYLDVSGSVYDDVKRMLPLIYKLTVNKLIDTYVFSNKVVKLSKKDIKEGNLVTTGGTDVNCIFKDYYNDRNNKNVKVIIVTDGYFDSLDKKYLDLIKKHHTKVEVVLFGQYVSEYYPSLITKVINRFKFDS